MSADIGIYFWMEISKQSLEYVKCLYISGETFMMVER